LSIQILYLYEIEPDASLKMLLNTKCYLLAIMLLYEGKSMKSEPKRISLFVYKKLKKPFLKKEVRESQIEISR